jgi:thiol-disulfide isomerase/thioredoxin
MSPGVAVFLGAIGVLATLYALRRWMDAQVRRSEGVAAPPLDGPLGEAVRGTTLLWFHSPTCGPCRVMKPAIESLVTEGSAHSIDVQQHLEVAQAFGVLATPTTIAIVDGHIRAVRTGVLRPEALRALLS